MGKDKALDMKDLFMKKGKKKRDPNALNDRGDELRKRKKENMDTKNADINDDSVLEKATFFAKIKKLLITKEMAAKMGRDVELKLTLRDIIHYAVFFIFVSIVCLNNISKYDYYLTSAMKTQFDTELLVQIDNNAKLWSYLENVFLDGIYWKVWLGRNKTESNEDDDNSGDHSEVLHENTLIGAPRIKQVRVHNNSCTIHPYFAWSFVSCYGEYSAAYEDKKPYGPGTGTEWNYHSPSETGSPANKGSISVYGGGGYYTDLTKSKARTRLLFKELKDQIWINRGTRCININFSVYNSNLNLFALIDFMFEFPATGGILATQSITSAKVIRYVTIQEFLVLACELLVYIYLVYFAYGEARNIAFMKWKYFQQFWSYVEIAIIGMGFLLLGIGLFRFFSVRETLHYYKKNPGKYMNFEYICDLMIIFNNCSAAVLFLTYIKIFKYITFNKTMGQLNITLAKCRRDVFGFAIMFMILFSAFSALGHLLFGAQAESFNAFGFSMLTLLKTTLGDFDYKEIEQANPVLAPFFFILFIFLVFFVLLNMFLAIINDTYTDVKTELGSSSPELQMTAIISRGCFNFCRKIGCKCLKKAKKKEKSEFSITLEEINNVLKSCGFTDLEIEMFFQRYNIDPTVKIDESNVKNIMEELKGKYSRTQIDEADGPVVPLMEFIRQQNRLENIERAVGKLSNNLQTLLRKLENLDSIRHVKLN